MIGGIVVVHYLAGPVGDDLDSRESGLEAVEDGPLVLLGRRSAVVSVHHGHVVGVRSDDGYLLDGCLVQREHAVVLQENH